MDKINDKKEIIRKFQCVHCEEKPFTTKQNLLRHMTRKHKNVFETEAGINNDNPPIDTPNIDMLNEYLEIQMNEVEKEPEPEPIPNDAYLIHLRNEYKKYEHLYVGIDNRIRWNKNNADIDIERYKSIFWKRMSYILTDIKDLYAKPIE